jgi:hypothetical protein
MEPTTYEAEFAGEDWNYWTISAFSSDGKWKWLFQISGDRSYTLPRRIAALLNLGGHLSVEELESGRQKIVPAAAGKEG